jgi:methylamine dehydrogenase accessory protein MauD
MATAVLGARVLLAAVFAVAGIGKLRDLNGSRRAMRDFGIPARVAVAAGTLLPLAELAVAVGLVIRPSAQWAAVAALALLLAFIAGIANALRRGDSPDCHCFGQIHSAPAGRDTLIRNGLLAALAGLVVVEGPGPALDAWIDERSAPELVAVGTGIAAVGVGLWALQLWTERRHLTAALTSARRIIGTQPPGIAVGSAAPDFDLHDLGGETVKLSSLRERGRPMLLVFASPGCDSCEEILPKIARWQKSLSERLTIALISNGEASDHDAWVERHDVRDVLLQEHLEAIEAYRIRATPSAVAITREGTVASNPAESVFGIEPLVRLALRNGLEQEAERSTG